jgi:hypothetical protein
MHVDNSFVIIATAESDTFAEAARVAATRFRDLVYAAMGEDEYSTTTPQATHTVRSDDLGEKHFYSLSAVVSFKE